MFAARTFVPQSTPDEPGRAGRPGRHRRVVPAGLVCTLALAVMAVTAPAASAAPWTCDSFGYLFQSPNFAPADPNAPPHDVVQVDLATGDATTLPGGTPDIVNAVGYNVLDDYFYAWDLATQDIVRINSDLTLTHFPVPPGVVGGFVIGEVDPQGRYWILGGSGTPGVQNYYAIDFAPGSPTFGQVVASGTTTDPAGLSIGADWSWIGGSLYRVQQDSAGTAHLVRFDPATGVQTDLGALGFTDSGVGATYVDASGFLYASDNASGNIHRIDVVTLQSIFVTQGPSSGSNDGARCAAAPIPTITVTKTVDGRVRPADQFTVGLVKPDGSPATSATTSGTQTSVSTTNFPASQGKTYTITDAMTPSSPTPLSEYVVSIACTDAAGNVVTPGGSTGNWTLPVSDATDYTCNITNRALADLELVKSASPSPVVPGENVTFSFAVTNRGPSTATNLRVSDALPAGVTYVSASPGCSEAGGTVTCTRNELAPGASHTFEVTGRVASSVDGGVRNTATATSDVADPDPSNSTSTIFVPIQGRADLSMRKSASTQTLPPGGGQLTYTLLVRNNGPSDATGVRVTDAPSGGLTLVSAEPSQGACSIVNNAMSCSLGRLAAGGTAQVLVTAQATGSGELANTATVTGDQEDPDPGNNEDRTTVTVAQAPQQAQPSYDLQVSKRASDSRVTVGEPVTYRIVVSNSGPDAAPDVRVTDTLNVSGSVVSVRTTQGDCTSRLPLSCTLGTVAAGDSATITVVIRPRRASSRVRNTATATGSGTDTNTENNRGSSDIRASRVRLRVTKIASSSVVRAGQVFSYRIRVRNVSRGEARNVRVCDRLPSGLVYVSSKPKARLTRGRQCWTIRRLRARASGTYRITVRALSGASGRKVNRVTASGRDVRTARATRAVEVAGGSVRGGGVTG